MEGTNIFNRIVETIKQLLALFKDFFRSFGIKDELIMVPKDIKSTALSLGYKQLGIQVVGLIFAYFLQLTNLSIEHRLIGLGILLYILYKSQHVITEAFGMFQDAEREKLELMFNNYAVEIGNKIISKTAYKIHKYDEKNKFYKILENERILSVCKNYTLSIWRQTLTHRFDILSFVSTIVMLSTAIVTNSKISQKIFIPVILGFALINLLHSIYIKNNRDEHYKKQREYDNKQKIIVNDLLRVMPIVPQDIEMRINKYGETATESNKGIRKFTKLSNRSRFTVTLLEVFFQIALIIIYVLNINYDDINVATIAEITAVLLVFTTAMSQTKKLSGILTEHSKRITQILREEEDMKLILNTYHRECEKISNPKKIDNIHIKPFTINYVKESENDNPFTLSSKNDINIDSGEIAILYGPSGSGKSTFMNMITEKIMLDKSTEIPSTSRFLMYDEKLRFGSLSLYDELFCCSTNPDHTKMHEILNSFHLWNELEPNCNDVWQWLKEKRFNHLSNGQKQRIILAKMLYWLNNDIDVLVLDECTSGLDEKTESDSADAEKILEYIIRYANTDKHRIIIISTHQNINGLKNNLSKEFTFKSFIFEKDSNENVINEYKEVLS